MSTTARSLAADPRPWYREPWPWILMAGPFAVIAAGIVTYGLALNSENALVAGNYYKEGLGINRVIEQEQKARLLGYEAQLSFAPGDTVRVLLRGMGVLPNGLRLRLIHPTQAQRDHRVQLEPRERRHDACVANCGHEPVVASLPSSPTLLPGGEGSDVLPARAGRFMGRGTYEGVLNRANVMHSSRWYVHIEDAAGTWRITGEWDAAHSQQASLQPAQH